MRVSTLARTTALSLTAAAVVALTACAGADPGGTAASPGASTPPTGGAAASEPGYGENPCALLTAADITAALGQTVSDTYRFETTTDDTATVQRCALVTNGKPLTAAAFTSLSTLATGFTGSDLPNQTDAVVGVVLVTRTTPFDAADGDTSKFPTGSKTLSGVGTFGVVLASPTGGLGFAQTSPTELVVVYDAEDRAVGASQMEALLRAAVSHR